MRREKTHHSQHHHWPGRPHPRRRITFRGGFSFQPCRECREGSLCVLPVEHALQQSSRVEKCNHWLSLEKSQTLKCLQKKEKSFNLISNIYWVGCKWQRYYKFSPMLSSQSSNRDLTEQLLRVWYLASTACEPFLPLRNTPTLASGKFTLSQLPSPSLSQISESFFFNCSYHSFIMLLMFMKTTVMTTFISNRSPNLNRGHPDLFPDLWSYWLYTDHTESYWSYP